MEYGTNLTLVQVTHVSKYSLHKANRTESAGRLTYDKQ